LDTGNLKFKSPPKSDQPADAPHLNRVIWWLTPRLFDHLESLCRPSGPLVNGNLFFLYPPRASPEQRLGVCITVLMNHLNVEVFPLAGMHNFFFLKLMLTFTSASVLSPSLTPHLPFFCTLFSYRPFSCDISVRGFLPNQLGKTTTPRHELCSFSLFKLRFPMN